MSADEIPSEVEITPEMEEELSAMGAGDDEGGDDE